MNKLQGISTLVISSIIFLLTTGCISETKEKDELTEPETNKAIQTTTTIKPIDDILQDDRTGVAPTTTIKDLTDNEIKKKLGEINNLMNEINDLSESADGLDENMEL